MSTPTTGLPVAGWYTDPRSINHERWWDGAAWTSHERPATPAAAAREQSVARAPEQVVAGAPEPTVAFDPAAAAAELRSGGPQVAPVAVAPASTEQFGSPSANAGMHRPANVAVPTRSSTLQVWLLVFWPLVMTVIWTLTIAAIVAGANIAGSPELALLPVFITCAALALLPLLWAVRDRNLLRSFGFQRPAHWAWMFLSPLAYLIARSVRTRSEAARGSAPMWVHASLFVAWIVIGNAIALTFDPAPFASQVIVTSIEQGIENGAAQKGVDVVAQCPGEESTFAPNKSFECIVTVPDGQQATITVTWGDTYYATPTISDLIFGAQGATE